MTYEEIYRKVWNDTWEALSASTFTFEQAKSIEHMPWGALFYDRETDLYYDGNGDEL